MVLQVVAWEQFIVAHNDRDRPKHAEWNAGSDDHNLGEVPDRDEHLHVMSEDTGLVGSEIDAEQILCLAAWIGDSVAIDPEWNVETSDSG